MCTLTIKDKNLCKTAFEKLKNFLDAIKKFLLYSLPLKTCFTLYFIDSAWMVAMVVSYTFLLTISEPQQGCYGHTRFAHAQLKKIANLFRKFLEKFE